MTAPTEPDTCAVGCYLPEQYRTGDRCAWCPALDRPTPPKKETDRSVPPLRGWRPSLPLAFPNRPRSTWPPRWRPPPPPGTP